MTENSSKKINWDEFKGLNDKEIENKAEEILALLTLKERMELMTGDGVILVDGIKMLIRYNAKPVPAGVIKRLGIPGVLFTDGPRGIAIGKSTCFPVSMARGAAWDIDLEERIGNAVGIEGRAHGANYYGGVCINLLRHPAWGRAQETYGEDSFLLGEMGAALTRGVQNHIMACAKHYACNSIENARFKVDVNIDERTLREVYLPHFKRCVDEGIASIMSAYNKVNGKYCGHNPHLLTDILKEDWKFQGFVLTDFFLGIRNGKLAVNAGVDIEMPFKWRMSPRKLRVYLKKGIITEEQIDDSCKRILRQLIRFVPKGDPSFYSKEKIACKEHSELALEAARKGIVLLKNEDKILPLNKKKVKKIAILGKLANMENIGDHGSSRVQPPYVVTPLEGIKKVIGSSTEVFYDDGSDLEKVKDLVRDVEFIIIVVGYTHRDEGEFITAFAGGDRTSLRLREIDEELITAVSAINKNVIVVLEGGSAIITEQWKDKVPAILMIWYPGMEGGIALGEVLIGDVNPSGKIPVVFPKSDDQLPFFDRDAKSIEYGYYHGYKLMDKEGFEPTFPFGFGLSYTTFSYDNLKVDKKADVINVSVDITNTGSVFGEEIAQLYIGYEGSSVDRPVKELKGFEKLALKPGKTKTLIIKVNVKDLAYYDVNSEQWIIEEIKYKVLVGPSSRKEDLLSASLESLK
jgi:beta-glucosidase